MHNEAKAKSQICWTVYQPYRYDNNGNPSACKILDEVFFNENCDQEYVKESLINHDGFPSDIIVEKSWNNNSRVSQR